MAKTGHTVWVSPEAYALLKRESDSTGTKLHVLATRRIMEWTPKRWWEWWR